MPIIAMSYLVLGPQACTDPAPSPLFLSLSPMPLALWGAPGELLWVLSAKEYHSPSSFLICSHGFWGGESLWSLFLLSALPGFPQLLDSLRLIQGSISFLQLLLDVFLGSGSNRTLAPAQKAPECLLLSCWLTFLSYNTRNVCKSPLDLWNQENSLRFPLFFKPIIHAPHPSKVQLKD